MPEIREYIFHKACFESMWKSEENRIIKTDCRKVESLWSGKGKFLENFVESPVSDFQHYTICEKQGF